MNIASATTSQVTARHGGAAEEEPRFNLEALELRTIRAALASCDWNISRAARLLGLSRDTLRYRIKRLDICAPSARATTSTETS